MTRRAKQLAPGFLAVNRDAYEQLLGRLRAADDDGGGHTWPAAMTTFTTMAVAFAHPETGVVAESGSSLAWALGQARNTVAAHLRLLEAAGMVERHPRGWRIVVYEHLQGRAASPPPAQSAAQSPAQTLSSPPGETPPIEVEKKEEEPPTTASSSSSRAREDDPGGVGGPPSTDNPSSPLPGGVNQERGDDVKSSGSDGDESSGDESSNGHREQAGQLLAALVADARGQVDGAQVGKLIRASDAVTDALAAALAKVDRDTLRAEVGDMEGARNLPGLICGKAKRIAATASGPLGPATPASASRPLPGSGRWDGPTPPDQG